MFNNQPGGSRGSFPNQRNNVNTNLFPLFGENMMLNIALWNNKVSLSFTPAIGKDGNGVTRYDREHRINTALSSQKCAAIVYYYDKMLKKYVEKEAELPEGTVKAIGFQVGGNRDKGVAPGEFYISVENIGGEIVTKICLAKNVTEMGTTPDNVVEYVCAKTQVHMDYIPTLGGDVVSEEFNGDLEVFLNILRIEAHASGIANHGIRLGNMFAGGGQQNNNSNPAAPTGPALPGSSDGFNPADFGLDGGFSAY